MSYLSDRAVAHLRRVADEPDLSGTRYDLGERLGRGGMATVYRAHDRELRRDVALKVLPLSAGDDADAAARLRREARILARLEHPGIVPVHDLGLLPDGRVYYVMKRVDGRSLAELLGAGPASVSSPPASPPPAPSPPGEAERLRLFLRVCEAVAFAHAHGVVHRDLKPENVMVGPFGEVLVMDWGVAKLLAAPAGQQGDGTGQAGQPIPVPGGAAEPAGGEVGEGAATAHGTVVGTPGYMAPEQARGEVERQDRRADVYALGALLAFVLTGSPPHGLPLDGSPPDGSPPDGSPPTRGTLPAPLAAVVDRALAADPAARYGDVGELMAEVSNYLAGLPVRAHREGVIGRLRRLGRRYRLPLALILAYMVMRLVVLLLTGF